MSYSFFHHPPPSLSPSSNQSMNRSRRAPPRLPKSLRSMKSISELTEEPPSVNTFRDRFEAGRSFELDDDLEFCPAFMSDEDLMSIHSLSSDRSSEISASPESSPLQHQLQPSAASAHYMPQPSAFGTEPLYSPLPPSGVKLQPAPFTNRVRNAIPIVNPMTGMRVSSPPLSSPQRQTQTPPNRKAW